MKSFWQVKSKQKNKVKVGIIEEVDGPHQDIDGGSHSTLVQVAAANEFGDGHIPQRSFVRSTVDNNKGYATLIKSLVGRIQDGQIDINSALHILGAAVVNGMKKTIDKIILPLNDKEWEERKGNSTPLKATEQMYNSISYQLEKK